LAASRAPFGVTSARHKFRATILANQHTLGRRFSPCMGHDRTVVCHASLRLRASPNCSRSRSPALRFWLECASGLHTRLVNHPHEIGCDSIDAIDHRTIHDETNRPEWLVVETREESFGLEVSDFNRVGQARAVAVLDRRVRPCRRKEPPQRTIVEIDGWNTADLLLTGTGSVSRT
jgi:hypothetical protein